MNRTASIRIALGFVLLLAAFPASPQDARTFFRQGRDALSQHNYYQAVDFFRSAIRENPAYADARLGMVEALFQLGEFKEADREMERTRIYAESRRDYILLEARLKTALGQYEEAVKMYTSLLEKRPHDAEANRGLAETYAVWGQRELANETYEKSLEYEPDNRRALSQVVLLRDNEQKRPEAEAALSKLLQFYPNDVEVRLLAANHYTLYADWAAAEKQLVLAENILPGTDAIRHRKIALLKTSLAVNQKDFDRARTILENVDGYDKDVEPLYLLARIYRGLGKEERAQNILERILILRPDDEIVQIYREEPLIRTSSGLSRYRKSAAAVHLEEARLYEKKFMYDGALSEYRLARLINPTDIDVWLAYANIIRKKDFPQRYSDEMNALTSTISPEDERYASVSRTAAFLKHSESKSLIQRWNFSNVQSMESSSWRLSVYVSRGNHSLPFHNGAQLTLASRFAYLMDAVPGLKVLGSQNDFKPEAQLVDSFADAFRKSRGEADYFIMLRFDETERRFGVRADLYLAQSGELIQNMVDVRTGQYRVSKTLGILAGRTALKIPKRAAVAAVEGNRVLLDKGRWQNMTKEKPFIAVRKKGVRPSAAEGGIAYDMSDYLGTVTITEISEMVSEGVYEKAGDFNHIAVGDDVFALPVPDAAEDTTALDPALRDRLLSVP